MHKQKYNIIKDSNIQTKYMKYSQDLAQSYKSILDPTNAVQSNAKFHVRKLALSRRIKSFYKRPLYLI